jgi:hypothetical protein
MITAYQAIVSRYYRIQAIFCGTSFLVLGLIGFLHVFHIDLFVAWQTRFMLGLIDCLLIIVSIAHAWLLWRYVGTMREPLEQLGEQYDMSEIKRRKFGLSGRDVYRRYVIDLCLFNAILFGIFSIIR